MKKFIILLLIISSMIFQSCHVAPKHVLRVEPMNDKTMWLQGKEYINLCNDNLEMNIAFDELANGYFVFNVQILNHSTQTLLVAPENFYCYLYQNSSEAIHKYQSTDPEAQLLRIDKHMEREEASYSSEVRTDTWFSFFDTVGDIATIGQSKTKEEYEAERKEDIEQEKSEIRRDQRHETRMEYLSKKKFQWAEQALRKTSLQSHREISGKVYFPVNYDCQYMELKFEIEKQEFSVKYRIKKYSI